MVTAAVTLGAACGSAAPGGTPDSAGAGPPVADSLLSARRVAALPVSVRSAWTRYIDSSLALQTLDRDSMARELRALGRQRPTRAPYIRAPFHEVAAAMVGDTARRVADIVLSFQTPSGGWSKHVDMTTRPRQPGESYYSESDGWRYIATIDNGATTSQMRFLAVVFDATGEPRYRTAFLRAVEYLRRAQFPNGC